MSSPSSQARLVPLGICVAILAGAASASAPEDDGLARRVPITVFTTTRREKHFQLMPGEWLLCSSRRGLWMPYLWPDKTTLRFQKHGACVFALGEDGKEGALLGVRLGTTTGRSEIRSAVKLRCNPLTIWCVDEPGIRDVPDLPAGIYYALYAGTVNDLKPISRLKALKALNVVANLGVADLSPLAELTELESLILRCDDATDLRPLARLTKLKVLHIYGGEGLTDLSPLASLKDLRLLQIRAADAVTDLTPLAHLRRLGVLVLQGSSIEDISPLAALTRLTWLGLRHCERLSDLSTLRRLTRLTHLDLSQCPQVADLRPLADLTDLEHLDLHGAAALTNIEPLRNLTKLQHLDLLGCHQISDLWPLRRVLQGQPQRVWVEGPLRNELRCALESKPSRATVMVNGQFVTAVPAPLGRAQDASAWVNIVGRTVTPPAEFACGIVSLVFPIRERHRGAVLDFRWDGPTVTLSVNRGPRTLAGILANTADGRAALSRALVDHRGPLVVWADAKAIPSLPPLPAGSDVTLVTFGLGVPLSALATVRGVTGLHVYSCGTLTTSLRPLAHLTSLRVLHLPTGPRLTSLRHLAAMTQLTSLSIRLDPEVDDLRPLAKLRRLRQLGLTCSQTPDLTPLAALPDLRALSLEGDLDGSRLRGLDSLTRLESLSLRWSGHPADFALLSRLTNLRALHLADCRNVDHLSPLAGLGNLEVLSLRECDRVVNLAAITRLPKLRTVELDLCDGIRDFRALRILQRRGVELSLDTNLRRRLDAATEADGDPPPQLYLSPK